MWNSSSKEKSGTRQVLGFMFMPQFGRSMASLSSALSMFVQMLAILLADAKLVPQDHPLVRGKGGQRGDFFRLMKMAAHNVKYDRDHIPQIMTFWSIALSLGFIAISVTVILFGLGIRYSSAAPSSFEPPDSANDLATNWIGQVFGTDGREVFSNERGSVLQEAFVAICGMYTGGILILACLYLLYIVIKMVIETAQSGKPFGDRTNVIWTPIRLVFALALLIPVGSGFNTGQYLVLNVARWGAGFGSQVWSTFAVQLNKSMGEAVVPPVPDVQDVVETYLMTAVCQNIVNNMHDTQGSAIEAVLGAPFLNFFKDLFGGFDKVEQRRMLIGGIVDTKYSWGTLGSPEMCGSITFVRTLAGGAMTQGVAQDGEQEIATRIYDAHHKAFFSIKDDIEAQALPLSQNAIAKVRGGDVESLKDAYKSVNLAPLVEKYRKTLLQAFEASKGMVKNVTEDAMTADMISKGFGAAGLYFNTLARINKAFSAAAAAIPKAQGPNPKSLETYGDDVKMAMNILVAQLNAAATEKGLKPSFPGVEYGQGRFGNGIGNTNDGLIHELLSSMLRAVGVNTGTATDFKWTWFLEIDKNNPVGSLATYGDWLMGLNMAGLALSVAMNISIVGNSVNAGGTAGSMVMGMLMATGFGGGFLLAYMLPLVPFLRFFFGILSWMTLLFQAIVGVPIMALGHMKTDGDGLAAGGVTQGYMILLNMFLRPALMIFGLIGSILLVNFGVGVLNDMFHYAVVGAIGQPSAGMINTLSAILYMIIYAFVAYSLCNTCFKMIDLIPEKAFLLIGGPVVKDDDEMAGLPDRALGAAAGVAKAIQGGSSAVLDHAFKSRQMGGGGGGGQQSITNNPGGGENDEGGDGGGDNSPDGNPSGPGGALGGSKSGGRPDTGRQMPGNVGGSSRLGPPDPGAPLESGYVPPLPQFPGTGGQSNTSSPLGLPNSGGAQAGATSGQGTPQQGGGPSSPPPSAGTATTSVNDIMGKQEKPADPTSEGPKNPIYPTSG